MPTSWRTWPATLWKGIIEDARVVETTFAFRAAVAEDHLARRSARPELDAAGAVGRRNARGPVQRGRRPHGALRLESRRRRVVSGAAHDVRLPPRSTHLGHRSSD